jgi:hypothetical protein
MSSLISTPSVATVTYVNGHLRWKIDESGGVSGIVITDLTEDQRWLCIQS